jgi:predicted HicB family RNase H-like nuclease
MNTLRYKGFIGSVNFSEEDSVFFGKIEGINGMVNFEGQSVQELTEAFHGAVDDYLAYCEEEGVQPHKSYSGSLNVRLTPEIHSHIAMLAACRYLYQCFHQTSTGEANYSYVIE